MDVEDLHELEAAGDFLTLFVHVQPSEADALTPERLRHLRDRYSRMLKAK